MNAESLVSFCDMLQQWGRMDDARKVAAGIVVMHPSFGPGWMKYSELCAKEDQLKFAQHAVKLAPERADFRIRLAAIALDSGNANLARELLEQVERDEIEPWAGRARVMISKRL